MRSTAGMGVASSTLCPSLEEITSMGRCSKSTEMRRLIQRTTLIWPKPRYHHLCGTSSVQEWAGRWYTTARSFMQTTRGFAKDKHQRQSQQCPMRLPIKDCCLLPPIQPTAAAPRQTGALLSQSILAYHSFSLCFLFRTEQTMGMEPRT